MAVIDWIAILAGFGSAVLASLGMGGGSILILYLTLMAGVPQREAQGMNLLFFLPIGAASLWLHWRQGRVDKTAVRQFLPTGLLGCAVGCCEDEAPEEESAPPVEMFTPFCWASTSPGSVKSSGWGRDSRICWFCSSMLSMVRFTASQAAVPVPATQRARAM